MFVYVSQKQVNWQFYEHPEIALKTHLLATIESVYWIFLSAPEIPRAKQ